MSTSTTKAHDHSQKQLLEAAGKVFARVGFAEATIRQIVVEAGTSLGAVNYHFGDKAGLYRAVLAYAHRQTIEQFREAASVSAPDQRLTRYIHALLSHVLGTDPEAWPGRLLCNELSQMIAQQTKGRGQLIRRYIQPRLDILFGIVRALIGPEADGETVAHHLISVLGQCTYYLRSRPVAEAALGRPLSEDDLETLTDHVARNSLAGIRATRTMIEDEIHPPRK